MTLNEYIEYIKKTLKSRGLTQKDLAEMSDIPVSTMRKIICRVNAHPRQKTLNKIADTLEIERFSYDKKKDLILEATVILDGYDESTVERLMNAFKDAKEAGFELDEMLDVVEKRTRARKRAKKIEQKRNT